ncbi:MAG: ABC transporter ATP-binding protein [Planctomycetota bacterium]|jgi:ABC-type multidrug transport system fused ATPase/permease subunit
MKSEGATPARPGKGSEAVAARPPPMASSDGISYRKLLRWSWFVVRGTFGLFSLSVLLALLLQTLGLYLPVLAGAVIDGLQERAAVAPVAGDPAPTKAGSSFLDALVPAKLETMAILLGGLLVGVVVLGLVTRLVTALADNLMVARLQRSVHDRLLTLGPDYHRTHDVGTSTVLLSQFVQGTQMLFKDFISFPVVRGIGLVTAVAFLMGSFEKIGGAPSWMNLALIVTLLVLPIGTWWFATRARRAYTRVRASREELSEEILNSLSQPSEVQVLGAEAQRSESFGATLARHVRNVIGATMRTEGARQFQTATPHLLRAVFIIYAVFFMIRSESTNVGAILVIWQLVPEAVAPLQDILQFFVSLNTAWPQVSAVADVMEAEPEVKDRPDAVDAPDGSLPLAIDHLTFAYTPGGNPILDDVSHVFEPGTVTAIVARSGGGKSTLFNLLCRLTDPQGGAVRFGDRDIRTLRLASFRRKVARVSQFPLFIVDTLRANFHLADPTATDEEIRAVCERTGLWEVLERAVEPPLGPLDYVLPRAQGQGLSGGERRLLAITRALLCEPAALLLDEPTTGIDALGRQRLIQLVRSLPDDIAVVLVDHNVQEFISQTADEICVLEQGRFVQTGTPAELVNVPGLYQTLYLHGEEREEEDEGPPGEPRPAAPPDVGAAKGGKPGGAKGTP